MSGLRRTVGERMFARTAHEDDRRATAVLAYVLERRPAIVHEDELRRAFAGDEWGRIAGQLVVDGLLYRVGGLCLASRAAARAVQLLAQPYGCRRDCGSTPTRSAMRSTVFSVRLRSPRSRPPM